MEFIAFPTKASGIARPLLTSDDIEVGGVEGRMVGEEVGNDLLLNF